eukprot:jgi/Botrbrau1/9468/Bobra.0252s0089.1
MKLKVQLGSSLHDIEVPESAKCIDLKQEIENATRVLVRTQKLIFKGKVIHDKEALAERNIKEGSKLLLLATSSAQVQISPGQALVQELAKEKAAKALERAKEQNASRAKQKADALNQSTPPLSFKARASIWGKTGVIGLRGEGLAHLPPEVFDVGSAARMADVGGNALETIPQELCRLPALQRLRLSHNLLTSEGIPDSLSSLTGLTILAADHNRLSSVPPPVLCLTNLRDLNLSYNSIQEVPTGIGSLTELQRLGLARNRLEALPEDLGDCRALESLDVGHNQLMTLPSTLSRLRSLRELLVDENRLKGLPSDLLRGCSSLCTLSLHGNPMTVDELRETDGFAEYNARRIAKVNKQMESQVLMGSQRFDEGADVDWQRWA